MVDQGASNKATGRIDCLYKSPNGTTQRYSIIHFNLQTQYDSGNRVWHSGGTAISDNRNGHNIKLTYDESQRVLNIDVNGYVFGLDQSMAMASNYNDRSTLNIKFLKDAEGFHATGDRFTIRGNSRLDISL